MSKLSIGLVTSPSEESNQLIELLEILGVEIAFHISPNEISNEHIQAETLNVWLLNVNDDDWHDNIDQLLDESEASIYFNEPGNLSKQSHPKYWCQNLVSRLYELTGLKEESQQADDLTSKVETDAQENSVDSGNIQQNSEQEIQAASQDSLTSALDELESNSVGLPSDIAADLVSELESISPELEFSIDEPAIIVPQLEESEHLLEIEEQPSELEIGVLSDFDEESKSPITEESYDIADETISLDDDDEMIPMLEDEESIPMLIDSNENVENSVDEFDLSNPVNSVLESARESEPSLFESVYDVNSEPESSNEKNEKEELLAVTEDFIDDLDKELLETSEVQPESIEFDLLGNPNSLSDELSLEDMNDDQEFEVASEELSDSNESDEYDLSEFSLESMEDEEQQLSKGKAVYLDDDSELAASSSDEPKEESTYDEGGLTLELMDGELEAPTGKATFVIDDEPKESEIQNELPASPKLEELSDRELTDEPEDELAHLTLELQEDNGSPVEQQTQPEELAEKSLMAEENEFLEDSFEQSESEKFQEPELIEEMEFIEVLESSESTDSTEGLLDFEQVTLDQDESETFEIPMLDDAAMGLQFDEPAKPSYQPAELGSCWVIGASLGGPAAVKRFLQSLPEDINCSFIIAQHIDENFLPVLADILTTSSSFEVKVANGSNPMSPGKIYLAPLKGKIIFLQDGSMLVDHSQKWSEPYSPCIDDVIESVSAVYKEKSGAIIFSGMGQDGLNGSQKMKALGGTIWAQSVDTCANGSMPDAVIAADLTSVVESPEMLAEQLAEQLAK